MKSFAFLALLCMLHPGAAAPELHEHANTECGYRFMFPVGWEIASTPSAAAGACVTILRPSDYAKRMADYDVDLYTISVSTKDAAFLTHAADVGFEFRGGEWMVNGGMERLSKATPFETSGLWGVRATATVTCHRESGGSAGLCEQYVLVASDFSDRVLTLYGGALSADAFDVLANTFRFSFDVLEFSNELSFIGPSRVIASLKNDTKRWAEVLGAVESGLPLGINMAQDLHRVADGEMKIELHRALSRALVAAPENVVGSLDEQFAAADICRSPYPSDPVRATNWKRQVLEALDRVGAPYLAQRRDRCRDLILKRTE